MIVYNRDRKCQITFIWSGSLYVLVCRLRKKHIQQNASVKLEHIVAGPVRVPFHERHALRAGCDFLVREANSS